MKVFLSWSGNKGCEAASVLGVWLSKLIESVQPWHSDEMRRGPAPFDTIMKELRESHFGILCLTKEGRASPWIPFEMGVLLGSGAQVTAFLLDMPPKEVSGPIQLWSQHTLYDQDHLRLLFLGVNDAVKKSGGQARDDGDLKAAFDAAWTEINEALERAARPEGARSGLFGQIDEYFLHHVSLPVRKLRDARDFYCGILGLREVSRPKLRGFEGVWLELPDGRQLHLLESDNAAYPDKNSAINFRDAHLAIQVPDEHALRRAFDFLKGRSIVVDGNIENAVAKYLGIYFRDQDGHMIEINVPRVPQRRQPMNNRGSGREHFP